MIPIYRAKKIDSSDYVIGYLHKIIKNQNSYYGVNKDKICSNTADKRFYLTVIDKNDIRIDGEFIEIYPSTLSIHFPDMLDSEGNKIFASLSEDGKGGDSLEVEYSFNGTSDRRVKDGIALFTRYFYSIQCKIDGENIGFAPNYFTKIKLIGIQQ